MAMPSPLATIRYRLAARLLGVPAAKSNPVGALVSSWWTPGSPVYSSRSFEALAREGFENNGYVFRAISIISQACAGIPWLLYRDKGAQGSGARRRGGKVNTQEVDEHPLLDLLAHPHGQDSITGTGSLIEQFVSYYVLSGNSYLTALRPTTRNAPPQELWIQQPGRMRVVPAADGTVQAYRYTVGGKHSDFDPGDVLHWKSFNPLDDWYGLSPVGVAARIVDQMNSANDWNTALLQNMARPGGFLVAQGNLPDPIYERLQLELKAKYASAKNAGRPQLLEGGLDWKQVGLAPSDMDWLEGKKTNVREIAVILGVPGELLGDSTNKTYSNYSEARRSFYTETVLPLMDVLRDLLNAWLVPMYGDAQLRLDYDRDDIEALQEDRALVWTRAKESYVGGLLTLNEARDLIGYDAIDDGDVVLAPPRTLTLDQLLSGAGLPPSPSSLMQLPAKPPTTPPSDSAQGLPPAPQQGDDGSQQPPALPPGKMVDADRAYKSWAWRVKAAITKEQRDRWIDELTKQAAAQFAAEEVALATILDDDGSDPDDRVKHANDYLLEQAAVWAALLALAYKTIGKAAGDALYHQWQDDSLIPDDATFSLPDEDDDLDRVIAAKADAMATYSGERLSDALTAALVGVAATEASKALLDALHSEYSQWTGKDGNGGSRSDVIGVTEAVGAWGMGRYAAASQAADTYDLTATHTWHAVMDNKTRDDHAAADGQTAPLGEPYTVGGESLMYPGDPSGSAAQVANCRCDEEITATRNTPL